MHLLYKSHDSKYYGLFSEIKQKQIVLVFA